MKTCGEFFRIISETNNHHAKSLLDYWQENVPKDEWGAACALPLDYDHILALRDQISALFAWRIRGICTEAMYKRVTEAHVEFVEEFQRKAGELGFIITEKRKCVSFVEFGRDQGIIQVTDDKGVTLTPKGEKLAEEVRREITGETDEQL